MWSSIVQFVEAHTWVLMVFGIVLATLIVQFIARRLFARLAVQFKKTHNLYDDALLDAIRRPAAWMIWVIGITWAAELTGQETASDLFGAVDKIRDVAVLWLLVWFALRFIRFVEGHVSDAAYRRNPVDPTTATAVGKLLRASVLITGILMAMQTLGFSISGVLAFGGIGGIAIGFAARDLLANFFGALMVFLDRPFSVGDWVRSSDREIEGTVEDVGWRLTRIRTFDQRPLYVPNAIFTSITVENPSRMLNRRIYETIGVRYDDVDTLPKIIDAVEAMLKTHPAIDLNRTLMVNFVSFGASSLDFFVYTFTKTIVWTEYHAIKQDVLFRIADIINEHGAEIAFPTQTLLVQPEPGSEVESRSDTAVANS